MQFSEEFIKEVIEKADIVKVISNFIDVVKVGNSYRAICPFHNDTRPSLNISTTKNIFKCFSCNTGGNAISFVMKYTKVSFTEAVIKVCEICNIPLPTNFSYQKKVDPNERLYTLMDTARNYYMYRLNLPDSITAKEYLNKRGLSSDIVSHFCIGYAPKSNKDIVSILTDKKGYTYNELNQVGITTNNVNNIADRFRNRIMFPITNINGRTIGFSGRIFDEEDSNLSKYMNSPQTLLFDKSNILYHYFEGKDEAKKEGCIYIVEGFMDCIALYKAGIKNCVALMGTAFTKFHFAALKKLNVELRLLLDSDLAGQLGIQRIIEIARYSNVKVSVVKPFTEVKDSDEYLSKFSQEKLNKRVKDIQNILDYQLDLIIKDGKYNLSEKLSSFINDNSYDYLNLNEIDQQLICQRISNLTNIPKEEIEKMFLKRSNKTNKVTLKNNNIEDNLFKKNTAIYLNAFVKKYAEKNFNPGISDVVSKYITDEIKTLSYMVKGESYLIEIRDKKVILSTRPLELIQNMLLKYHDANNISTPIIEDNNAHSFLISKIESEYDEAKKLKESNEFTTKRQDEIYDNNDFIQSALDNLFDDEFYTKRKGRKLQVVNDEVEDEKIEFNDLLKSIETYKNNYLEYTNKDKTNVDFVLKEKSKFVKIKDKIKK